jgi:hypothetical protein
MSGATWPTPGQILVHRLRKRNGEITARVLEVERGLGLIRVEVNGTIYNSLSAAASAVSGHASNGWVFWGLKKQASQRKSDGGVESGEGKPR